MCDYIHLNAIASLQPGQDIKANCSVSPSILFTCGPSTDPTKHANYAVYAKGPTNLTLVMYSGSQYIHTNAGGLNQLDVSCQPSQTLGETKDVMLDNGAFVLCNRLDACCDSQGQADQICKSKFGETAFAKQATVNDTPEPGRILPVCDASLHPYAYPYHCWTTTNQGAFTRC